MKRAILILFTVFSFLTFGCTKEITDQEIEKVDNQQNKEVSELDKLIDLADDEILVATMQTNMGTIEFQLFAKETPKTVKNFAGLIQKGFYDGIIFHRVIDNFMIQGGDPTGTGRGGESIYGGKFEDEIVLQLQHDAAGILSMANAGPNTNGSQFFITLVPTPWLNGKHTVFGKVISGLEVVQAIGKVETSKPFDKPLRDVVMEKVTVEKRKK